MGMMDAGPTLEPDDSDAGNSDPADDAGMDATASGAGGAASPDPPAAGGAEASGAGGTGG
jgi:hypothetical protein